jgi:serine/threonine protein kinase
MRSDIPLPADTWSTEDTPFLVMKLASGAALDGLLGERCRLVWDVVVLLVRQVLVVLAYIHNEGIVWGDLKPGNIVVEGPESDHLLDFGAARMANLENKPDNLPVIGTCRRR